MTFTGQIISFALDHDEWNPDAEWWAAFNAKQAAWDRWWAAYLARQDALWQEYLRHRAEIDWFSAQQAMAVHAMSAPSS